MKKLKAEDITPQSFESNDGRFSVKVEDDGVLELTITELDASHDDYYNKEIDYIQTITFSVDDLDRLIGILKHAKKINTYNWKTAKEKNLVEGDK